MVDGGGGDGNPGTPLYGGLRPQPPVEAELTIQTQVRQYVKNVYIGHADEKQAAEGFSVNVSATLRGPQYLYYLISPARTRSQRK